MRLSSTRRLASLFRRSTEGFHVIDELLGSCEERVDILIKLVVTVVSLLSELRTLTEEATVPPWSVVSSDDFRAKQGKNATVGCGLEPTVVEDCLDGVERGVVGG